MTLCAVMRPVLGLAEGCSGFPSRTRPSPSPPRRGGCCVPAPGRPRFPAWSGRADAGQRHADRHVQVGREADGGLSWRAAEHQARLGDAGQVDVVVRQIGAPSRPRTGLRVIIVTEWISPSAAAVIASSPRMAPDGTMIWAPCWRASSIRSAWRSSARAQHHQLLAGPQHGLGQLAEHGGRRALHHHVAMRVQVGEGAETRRLAPVEGRRGLGIAHGHGRQAQAGQAGVQDCATDWPMAPKPAMPTR